MDVSMALQVVTPAVVVVIWLLRLEGRVNGHDRDHAEHHRRDDMMREDLSYIRDRIDKALNGHGK